MCWRDEIERGHWHGGNKRKIHGFVLITFLGNTVAGRCRLSAHLLQGPTSMLVAYALAVIPCYTFHRFIYLQPRTLVE